MYTHKLLSETPDVAEFSNAESLGNITAVCEISFK